ncbi:MAG: hypothetical protein Ta2B_12960 [Termitinemataceae bacterium]|nr:MAG: hypothetical protein Ta2B_12960 [Termitinemataceae bacterium]
MDDFLIIDVKDKDYPLSILLEDYNKGLLSKRLLEERVIKYVLDHYRIYMPIKTCSKDDFEEFICWLYPRLSKAIFRYREDGASFESFLYTYITYGYREYLSKQKENYLSSDYDLEHKDESLLACESEVKYDLDTKPEEDIISEFPLSKKHILILLLKSYYYVSEEFVAKIAINMGVDYDMLKDMIDKLSMNRSKTEKKYAQLLERTTLQYFRCINYEKLIPHYDQNSKRHYILNQLLKRGRIRLVNMRARLKHIHLDATNEEVANVLGIPKGTVDSVLAKLKMKNMLQ